jgi:photosystem II stability/assembly factor-like uncharacterized protein
MSRFKGISTFLIIVLPLILFSAGWSSQSGWREVGPYAGGAMPDFAFDPSDISRVYITSNMVGVFMSDDAGDHWRWSSNGAAGQKGGIAVDPSNPDILYAVGPDGIFQSRDKARHWEVLYTKGNGYEGVNNLKTGTLKKSIFGKPGQQVSIGPTGIVYVGTDVGDVLISKDKGDNFVRVSVGKSEINNIIPIDAENVIVALYNEGVFISGNEGLAWKNSMSLKKGNLLALAMNPVRRNVFYALVSKVPIVMRRLTGHYPVYLYQSVNYGKSWKIVSAFQALTIIKTRRLMDVSMKGTIIILTSRGPIRSENDGRTWSSISELHAEKNDGYLYANKGKWRGTKWSVYADHRKPERWYVSGAMAVFRSDDDGKTWHYKVNGLREQAYWFVKVNPLDPDIIIVSDLDHGLLRSTDAGKTWHDIVIVNPLEECTELRFAPGDDTYTILYGLFGHPYPFIAKSTDAGQTWIVLKSWKGRKRQSLKGFTLIKGGDYPVMFVGEPHAGIWKSGDEGRKWTKTSAGLPAPDAINYIHALESDSRGYLYVGIASRKRGTGGMYSSTNNGESWFPINRGLEGLWIRNGSFEIDPNNPDTLWVSSGRAVYRSTTCGKRWEKRIHGLFSSAILVEPGNSDVVYGAVFTGGGVVEQYAAGIYKSVDGGNYFFNISGDLFRTIGSTYRVRDLEYGWKGAGGIWAAPNGGGLIYTLPLKQND